MTNLYQICLDEGYTSDANDLASCLATQANAQSQLSSMAAESAESVIPLMMLSSTLVFFMQAGFSMVCAGCVRRNNVQNTVLKNLLDLCGSAISFFSVGYAFAYGSNDVTNHVTFIGTSNFFLVDMAKDDSGVEYCKWFFQCAFAATSGKCSEDGVMVGSWSILNHISYFADK